MIMQAVFRVDSSEQIGFGHVVRSLTLADKLSKNGFQCAFICQQLNGNGIDLIERKQYRVHLFDDLSNTVNSQSIDAQKTEKIIQQNYGHIHLLVVDHYGLSDEWEQVVSSLTSKLLVIDDLANRSHHCDYLLDVSIQRQASDYAKLCRPEAQLLIGPDFSLLRDEFSRYRQSALEKRKTTNKIQKILLSFGATDPTHLTLSVLDILNEIRCDSTIDIAVSSKCSWLADFDASRYEHITIQLNVDNYNLVPLMLESDLAIGAIGGSTWERACLGLPCISITNSDLQTPIVEYLHKHDVIVYSSLEDLKMDIAPFLKFNFDHWYGYVKRNSHLIDGLGCERVLKNILRSSLQFKPLTMEYADQLFEWQCQPQARQYSRNPQPPSHSEHINWLQHSLDNPLRRMWVIQLMGEAVGYVRLDELEYVFKTETVSTPREVSINTITEEVSILISDQFHGMGIGKIALDFLQKNMKYETLIATVNDLNLASKQLFLSSGFTPCAHQTYLFERSCLK